MTRKKERSVTMKQYLSTTRNPLQFHQQSDCQVIDLHMIHTDLNNFALVELLNPIILLSIPGRITQLSRGNECITRNPRCKCSFRNQVTQVSFRKKRIMGRMDKSISITRADSVTARLDTHPSPQRPSKQYPTSTRPIKTSPYRLQSPT